MSARSKPVVAIHPLRSSRPTGMGMAATGIAGMLSGGLAEAAPGFDRAFTTINDHVPVGAVRMILRFIVAQWAAVWFWRRKLIYTSHHAPVWRTRRHAVVVHDLIALRFPEQARVQAWFYQRLLPRILSSAARVVSISATAAKELSRCFPGCLTTAVAVIPSISPLLGAQVRSGFSVAERRSGAMFTVLGARYPHKNLGTVLAAFKSVARSDALPAPRLTITSCERALWPDLHGLEQAGLVVVVDYASDAQIAQLLESSLALIFVSKEEGQGLPPLEAMAAGCPVICSDLPVLRETCGDAAWFVDPGDVHALAALLAQMLDGGLDNAIDQRRQAGFERARAFRPECVRDRWVEFLEGWE